MPWNLDSSRPIYLQIIERVQMDIITGRYQPGDKLPSVRDLAQEAAVNPNTMQDVYKRQHVSGAWNFCFFCRHHFYDYCRRNNRIQFEQRPSEYPLRHRKNHGSKRSHNSSGAVWILRQPLFSRPLPLGYPIWPWRRKRGRGSEQLRCTAL